jgi:hypothetical protein
MVSTALTGLNYTVVPNSYIAPENAGLLLKKGYGIAVGPGANTERVLGGQRSYARDFLIFLTRLIPATSNNVDARQDTEKAILEDYELIVEAIEEAPNINGKAVLAALISDGGLEYLEGDRDKYFLIETTVTVEYFNNISC